MPLAFLAPVFLVGLAALAIPVLIHLANRPKKEVQPFPSLMFLDRTEYRDASRRRLRNPVLFLLRALALVLLAAAFARPFLARDAAAALTPEGGREIVVLVDRSASMATGDRMARARQAVERVADGLRRGDRATVVAFDREAHALGEATDDPAAVRRAVASLEAGAGATRLVPALRLAESILSTAPLPRRELVVVSDWQADWNVGDAPSMPAGTEIRTVDVGGPVDNTFVADVRFRRERFADRERVRVAATVARRTGAAAAEGARPTTVELLLDGRVVAERTASLAAGDAATVDFDPVTLPDGAARGAVRVGSDAMPMDDARHFVLAAGRPLRVLLAARAPADPLFLERALSVGPDHAVTTVRSAALPAAALAAADVVVLAGEPAPESVERLAGWVEAGGGLIVALGPRSRGRTWGDALLPGRLGGTRDGGSAGLGLARLRLDHPVFEPFRDGDAGLGAARFFRYRELDPDPAASVLARFDDGAPAVLERSVGSGRVLALASPPDGAWNDLHLQPAFVPLVHRLVRHAAGREPRPAWRTVGELLDAGALLAAPPAPDADPGAAPVLLTPDDRAVPVRPDSLYPLDRPGFYQLRDPRAGAEVVVAVNVDPAESDPARVSPEEVVAAAGPPPTPALAASFAQEDRERRQGLWWYALAAAFVLMAVESAVANSLSRRPRPREQAREKS